MKRFVLKNNKTADRLIKEFLDDCRERLSSHSVKNNRISLKVFVSFLDGKNILKADKLDVRRFLNDFKQRGRARSTISSRLSALITFFEYVRKYHGIKMCSLKDIDVDDYPLATWEGQGQEALTRGEVRALIEAPDNLRDTLIIAMFYYLGLRANELASLKLENVDTRNRLIEVIGKGNKPRKIPYSSKLDRAIHLWLHSERISYVSCDGPYFFPSKHGKKLRTNSIHRIVHKAAIKAGIQKVVGKRGDGANIYKVHPQILRHSFATHASQDEIPLNHIQRYMGHSNILTTVHYAGENGFFGSYHEKFKGV